jgi:hypothetical protein
MKKPFKAIKVNDPALTFFLPMQFHPHAWSRIIGLDFLVGSPLILNI